MRALLFCEHFKNLFAERAIVKKIYPWNVESSLRPGSHCYWKSKLFSLLTLKDWVEKSWSKSNFKNLFLIFHLKGVLSIFIYTTHFFTNIKKLFSLSYLVKENIWYLMDYLELKENNSVLQDWADKYNYLCVEDNVEDVWKFIQLTKNNLTL